MNINTGIGLDSFKLFFEGRLKKEAINSGLLSFDTSSNEARNSLIFNTNKGQSLKCSCIRHSENKRIQTNFHSGVFTLQASIPKLLGQPCELLEAVNNKEAYNILLEHASEFAEFEPEAVRVSRIDVTRNIELNNSFYEYLPIIDAIPQTRGCKLQSTYTAYNKSFAHCIYDKVQELQDKRQEVPELFKNKFVARNEVRLLNGAKLKTDSKKIGLDLREPSTYIEADSFEQVKDLYLLYQQRLFKNSYKGIELAYIEAVNLTKQAAANGIKANNFLMLSADLLKILTLNQFANIYFSNSRRQYKYNFKRHFLKQLKILQGNTQNNVVMFSELLEELKTKSLALAA